MDKLPSLLIREMRKEELAFAAECTAAEGWLSENLTTLEGFYLNDPIGCLLAELKGQPVGICVATFYGKSGFIGELIVRSEARDRGVGAELLNHGVRVLKERGVETIYLDGVVRVVELYQRNGFHKVCRSWRFSGNLVGKPSPNVRRMGASDLDRVCTLDQLAFGADRSFFLRRRFEIFPELCQVLLDGDRMTGFILGREGEDWVSAGPWVMSEEVEDSLELLKAFALEAGGRPISIGILNTNLQACDLVRTLGFQERTDSPWRMVLGSSSDLGASPKCFAVGSAAKG
jgi:ribosomal protein S18 acetylase RimI-like enzyme